MGKKGGDTKTTSYSYDPVASRKLAEVAERQVAMSEEQWEMYKEFFQDYEIAAAESNKELLPFITEASKEFMTQAIEGIDIDERREQAEAEVVGAFDKVPGAMRRSVAQYGIDPSSQRFMTDIKRMGIDEAKAISGARTEAGRSGELEQFNRLAVASGKQPLAMADPAARAMGGMQGAASAYAPLATRVMSSKSEVEGGNVWDFLGQTAGNIGGMYLGYKMFGM